MVLKSRNKEPSVETDAVKETSHEDDTPKETQEHHKSHHKKKRAKHDDESQSYASKRLVFMFGAVIGVLLAAYLGAHRHKDFDKLFDLQDYVDDWRGFLPENIRSVLSDFDFATPSQQDLTENFSVGKAMKKDYGLTSKFPVVMVPGVISTGLESWGTAGVEGCPSQPHFRKRLWGSMYMIRTMFLDKVCWLKHIMLDPITGLDPEGITVRAAQGFEAADFFITGYWIWGKIIQNLAAIGYDPNMMITAAYDWRLAYMDLERRDTYFSTMKAQIELQKKVSNQKTILIGHSMGAQVAYYFMKWVEAEGEYFGNGGPNWINDNIAAFVDISGSALGAPKAVPALLSGEMKDTVQLNALAVYGLEKFFSRRERVDMLRTFGGIPSMFPKGGDLIWGTLEDGSADDELSPNKNETFADFIRFDEAVGTFSSRNLTMADSLDYLLDMSPTWFQDRVREQYSFGFATTPAELQANNQKFSTWSNPLEAPLPNAPDMKIYCFYGVGNPTERAYMYQEEQNKTLAKLNITIKAPNNEKSPVFFTDGDGTLPLLTHSMCHKWKTSRYYNPGGSPVKVVEIKHEPDRFDIRGGAKTAEHVDILGSAELNELILKVASGRDDLIEERQITNLSRWVSEMDFAL
ncbi:phospholipid:diacylglycerol acyltransferase [Cyberlindnera jadinii NRRL Y-1542]|uniref:Phospholipid:diacylglycerol acyltransferase n=1 Tax=Cyberlindnera jadinii (strain ATCC 18201 / CBS 1600 / BCRC 20928 / JCM 3617 / NBRC 0987 / NRRL Y-1542) TaxID=983966 RepID=A0A1E4RVQ5_CYBJN|nr:phospholipid:diacylglycerol acyltransferase [Cyberlindnera jadinii NRRL Y-1542]ODV71155.1 phospholipid:diacylglycerol acyltransferase [Cyberlindnera jadinii NRRL Y-1542]